MYRCSLKHLNPLNVPLRAHVLGPHAPPANRMGVRMVINMRERMGIIRIYGEGGGGNLAGDERQRHPHKLLFRPLKRNFEVHQPRNSVVENNFFYL